MRNSGKEEFGEERLTNIIESSQSFSARDICNRVLQSVLQFGNNNIQDDITLIALTTKE
jgi:serine phosphatase RsbU (regulator of sigma subunit)